MMANTEQKELQDLVDNLYLSPEDKAFCDPKCLRRYLVANKGNVSHALENLKETLAWRREYQPHKITKKDVEALMDTTYTHGKDKLGRPIIYVKKREAEVNPELGVKTLVYSLEQAILAMDGTDAEQWVLIFDMEKYSRSNRTPFHISRQVEL
jgi:hypothetical protein